MRIQCDNGKISTLGLAGANFLYFFGPKIITLGGIDGLVVFSEMVNMIPRVVFPTLCPMYRGSMGS